MTSGAVAARAVWAVGKAALVLALLADNAMAATLEIAGITPAGSAYRIAVPEGWTAGDGLVLVQHGYRFAKVTEPSLGPSAAAMLADGFAIAAPGYREAGWALPEAIQDNRDVLAAFRVHVGEPGSVVAHGGSMGALIALKMAEDDALKHDIDAVVALCPASDGVDFWDRVFDLRVTYDAICAGVPGGALPEGEAPTPFAGNLEVLSGVPTDPLALPATMREHPAVRACLGLHVPPMQRSAAQSTRLEHVLAVTSTDEETLAALLAYAHFGLADLVRSPDKLAGANPFHNEGLNYRSNHLSPLPVDFDQQVPRVPRDDFARLAFHRDSSLQGTIDAPVIAMQTSLDSTLRAGSLGLLQALLHRRLGGDVSIAVVREAVPTHCGFTQAEYDTAWDAGKIAAQNDSLPDFDAIATACAARGDAAACRFDADATQAALLSGLFDLRPSQQARFDSYGGLWWDPARPAQGFMIEELDAPIGSWGGGEQRVAVTWYTWAPQDDPNPGPRWFHGIGRVYETEVTVDMIEVRGGRFGALLDPANISYVPWGRVEMSFDDGPATLRYAGPPGWGSGTMRLHKLLKAGMGLGGGIAFSPPPSFDFVRSGTYYDPAHPAGGWVLNQFSKEQGADVGSLLLWFTWDNEGRPLWMYALDAAASDGLFFRMNWAMSGGRFEPGYPLSQVQLGEWGDVGLQGTACGREASLTRVDWRVDTQGFSDGDLPLTRLTKPTYLHAVPYCDP